MEKMSNAAVWDKVESFIIEHRRNISHAYDKFGWIHSAEREDTLQDIRICAFKTIRSIENDYIMSNKALDWEDDNVRKLLRNRIIGNYHAHAWRNRSAENLRSSDLYNVKPGSEDDCKLTSHSIEDIEAWGLFAPSDLTAFSNTVEPDVADYYDSQDLTAKIVERLLTILPANKPGIVKEVCLGGDCGFLTHMEAGAKVTLTRSAVTKSLKVSKKLLSDFCEQNGLSLNMPREELFRKVNELTAQYRAAKRVGKGKNSEILEMNVIDYLDSDPDDTYEYGKPIKTRRKCKRGRKKKRHYKEKYDHGRGMTVLDFLKQKAV